jgi:hypothetical protein
LASLPQPSRLLRSSLLVLALSAGAAEADPPRPRTDVSVGRICELIEFHAGREGLPPHFFARLIWKESRFDAGAVSPAGAEGIAQFMPGTAKARGLADPFSIEQAIPASARFLSDLKSATGNWGLAAAAYNAGETRVGRWLASGGFLPLETEDYVLDILGEPADNFTDRANANSGPLLQDGKPFGESCRALPVIATRTVAMSSVVVKPWGVQVAGNFRRAAALNQWQRLRRRIALLAAHDPVISRVRSGRTRRGIYAVRIGAESRGEANRICADLRAAGGSCLVMRNR